MMKEKTTEKNEPNVVDLEILHRVADEYKISDEDIFIALEDGIKNGFDRRDSVKDGRLQDDAGIADRRNSVVRINRQTGKIEIFYEQKVVEEVTDDQTEISLEEARLKDPCYAVGDYYLTPTYPGEIKDLGRVVVHQIKTLTAQKVTEAQRISISEEYNARKGEIVDCRVESIEEIRKFDKETQQEIVKKRIIVRVDEKIEGTIAPEDQMPGDVYRIPESDADLRTGTTVKACIISVDDKDKPRKKKNQKPDPKVKEAIREPVLRLSRSNSKFLNALLRQEIPEIASGDVIVKAIARNPGQRAKVAVTLSDKAPINIDAKSACIGPSGNRTKAITDCLGGEEKIDIIDYSDDLIEYVENSLQPANCKSDIPPRCFEEKIEVEHDGKIMMKTRNVVALKVPDNQLTLAIGKDGINVSLAARLCNCRIDIKSASAGDDSLKSARMTIFND